MHKHCAVEGMARKLIAHLDIRPEQLLGFGSMAPGVQSLSFYLADDIAQELAMCRRSDLIGMLANIVDGVSGLSDHALRIIASGLVLEKMVELLCLIDKARGGKVVWKFMLVKAVYKPAAPGGVEIHTKTIETPLAQRVAQMNLFVENRLPQFGREVNGKLTNGRKEDVTTNSDMPSDEEINELANDIDLDIDDEESDRIIDRYREGIGA